MPLPDKERLREIAKCRNERIWRLKVKYAEIKALAQYALDEETRRRKDCIEFFRWWWNQGGTNTEQGYDAWLKHKADELEALSNRSE